MVNGNRQLTWSYLILLNTAVVLSLDLYPFGFSNGDGRLPTSDDGFSSPIPIRSLFPFFNKQMDSLIVNNNGVISFRKKMSSFTATPFPLASNIPLIAPYWTDVDTTKGGDIWYRESVDTSLLRSASQEIRTAFPVRYTFQASWMFIATWENVSFFGANSIGVLKKCTFQCLLITNGGLSFAMFLYDKIEWTTGSASGGNKSTGLGGNPAQVGFDAGDGKIFFALEASRTPDIINVTQMSNIDIPGKFIFRVDSAEITKGGCTTNGTLTITPKEVSMFGGTLLVISGPCFDESETANFVMSNVVEGPCKFVSKFSVSCIAPAVYRTGKELVSLKMINNNTVLTFSGFITVVNHALIRVLITRYPSFWSSGSNVRISWNPVLLNFPINAKIEIDLFYPQAKSNSSDIELQHYSSLPPPNSTEMAIGTYSFMLNFTEPAGIVRVSANVLGSPYYWSDMFTVYVNISTSIEVCENWNIKEQTMSTIDSNGIIPCPCTLDVAFFDLARFHKDPFCREDECLYQPFAKLCFQQNLPSSQGHGTQCCYINGTLMNHRQYLGSGYSNRFHYTGGSSANIPFLSNFVNDIIPYHHCCVYPIKSVSSVENSTHANCDLFYRRRTPNSCLNFRPPTVGRVSGVSHFATFDGYRYTFNAIGEFLATENNNFTLQIRLEQFQSSQGSSVTAFATKPYDTADIVEVQTSTIRGIDVLVNGLLVDFDSLISNSLFNRGSKLEKSGDSLSVTVSFDRPQIAVQASLVLNTLNIFVIVSPYELGGHFIGLLGNHDCTQVNDLISRNGEIIANNSSRIEIHNSFGTTWTIDVNESLFTYPPGRQYSSYQQQGFNPVVIIPDNIDPNITDACGTSVECIYDYSVTGNRYLGQISDKFSQQYDIIYNITAAECLVLTITTTTEFISSTSTKQSINNVTTTTASTTVMKPTETTLITTASTTKTPTTTKSTTVTQTPPTTIKLTMTTTESILLTPTSTEVTTVLPSSRTTHLLTPTTTQSTTVSQTPQTTVKFSATTTESKMLSSTATENIPVLSTSGTINLVTNTAYLKNTIQLNDEIFEAMISSASVVIGLVITTSVVAVFIKYKRRVKKTTRELDHRKTYTAYGNIHEPQWAGFFKPNRSIMFNGPWTSYTPQSYPSFENVSYWHSGGTELNERVYNYRV